MTAVGHNQESGVERSRTDWLAIAVLFASGLVAAMQFSKVSPVMGDIAADLQLSPVAAGLSVSILGLVGVVFALTVGALVNVWGLVRCHAAAMFVGGIVALLGALAPSPFLFLFSRFCEGFSHLFIVVCAPALMAAAARPQDKPLALSIWGSFFGFGFALASLFAPAIVGAAGWRGLLIAHGVLMLAIAAVSVTVLRNLLPASGHASKPNLGMLWHNHIAVFRSGGPLLLALTFCAYTILFLAMLTFLKPFLQEVGGWTATTTGSFLAFASTLSLVFTLFAGILVRGGVTIIQGFSLAFAGLALSAGLLFLLQPTGLLLPLLTILVLASFGLMPGFAFANAPMIAPTPERAALTYGAIALFGNVGTFLGTPIFAAAHEALGWPGGALFVALASSAGIILSVGLSRAVNPNHGP